MHKPLILIHGKVHWNFFMRDPLSKRVMASPDCKKALKINFARYTLLNVTKFLLSFFAIERQAFPHCSVRDDRLPFPTATPRSSLHQVPEKAS